jgi:hypothetical protein
VVLTELSEGPMESPLQGVIEVISCGRRKPNRQARVRGVSWDVHMDLTTPSTELTVQAAAVRESPHVANAV